jgi:hypothetical protein
VVWLGVLLGMRLFEGGRLLCPHDGESHFEGGVCDGFFVRRREYGEFVEAICESVGNNVVL